MSVVAPVVASGVLVAGYGAVWTRAEIVKRRARAKAPARERAPELLGYGRRVNAELPAAWEAAGIRTTAQRQAPTIAGNGRPLGDGLVFPMRYAGWTAGELTKAEERLASALARRVQVGLVRIRPLPGQPGHAQLIVSRTHPLGTQLAWPGPPGSTPTGGRGLEAVIGQTEYLRPLIVDPAKTALWAGQNGSGKTWGLADMLLCLAPRPNVELTVYDASVKGGSGYSGFAARLRHGRVLTDRDEIFGDLEQIEVSLGRRAEILDGRPWSPTPALPLRLVLIEEFPGLAPEDEDLDLIVRLAQQGREFGFALHLASQNAHGSIVDTVLRAELRQRLVFRMNGWREVDMALGEGTRGGDGEDGYVPIPTEWPGVLDSVVTGETGVVRSRCWAPISSLADARAMFGGSIDWTDPRAVPNARMRCFVAQAMAALAEVKVPKAIDLRPKAVRRS